MWLMLTCLGATHHLSRDNMRLSDWMRCSHLVVTVAVFHPALSLFRLSQKLPATFSQLFAHLLVMRPRRNTNVEASQLTVLLKPGIQKYHFHHLQAIAHYIWLWPISLALHNLSWGLCR